MKYYEAVGLQKRTLREKREYLIGVFCVLQKGKQRE